MGKEKEEKKEEGERLANFFYAIHDFFVPTAVPNVFVPAELPAELPARYAIDFVPAAVAITPVISPPIATSTDYSVVSSVNFVVPSPVIVSSISTPTCCIEPN